ncbi:heat shock factor protein-like [Diadema antillarum]|uniref:heat shock factor protein-like n=1 Tax=Diadema antillarum TaxID=105358 RepID=UPI003A87FFBB
MASKEKPTTVVAQGDSVPKSLSCPAFLSKLWLLVDDKNTDEYIRWSAEGDSFIVSDQVMFASAVLPYFFKHNNMASFIRQLNMYGFRKRSSLEDGALKTDRKDIEFQHPHFLKGKINQLQLIKRKGTNKDETKLKPSEVGKMLSDVREMKGKQNNITSKLESMKNENQALWREVVSLRQRHEKQQKIVNHLIHFLISLVQPNGPTGKRRQGSQLMIADIPDGTGPSRAKYARTTPGVATIDEIPASEEIPASDLDLFSVDSVGGSAILSEVLPEPPISPDVVFPATPSTTASGIGAGSPIGSFDLEGSSILPDPNAAEVAEGSNEESLGGGQLVVAGTPQVVPGPDNGTTRPEIQRLLSNEEQRQELGDQLNNVQTNLKEFQNLIANSPNLSFELGGLLQDFQDFFPDPVTTLPEFPLSENTEMEEKSDNADLLRTSLETSAEVPPSNELVTYKPSTSYPMGAFMVDDEDSLFNTPNDDSLALQQGDDDLLGFAL